MVGMWVKWCDVGCPPVSNDKLAKAKTQWQPDPADPPRRAEPPASLLYPRATATNHPYLLLFVHLTLPVSPEPILAFPEREHGILH